MFDFDGTGIDINARQQNKVLPKQWFNFEVIEFVSKDGKKYPAEGNTKNNAYPKVDILVQVTTPGEFEGERLFHTVTFMPKDKPGAGMAIHWLKTIGQPWEGVFKVNSDAWVGADFQGYVVQDEYQGKKKNKISEIRPISSKNDEVPF
jgi:hypothetical protein